MTPTIIFTNETQFWTELPDCIEKILGMYLTDTDTVIHICSMTGSYECYFLRNLPVFKPNTSNSDQKAANEWILKHQDLSEPVTYFSEYSKFDHQIPLEYTGPDLDNVDHIRQILEGLIEDYDNGDLKFKLPFSVNPRTLTTEDFKYELRMMDFKYDPFGTVMEAWFQIAYHLADRDVEVPDDWEFRGPASFGPYADEDSYWYDIFIDATDEQLLYWGKLIRRYRQFIEHYNPDLIY